MNLIAACIPESRLPSEMLMSGAAATETPTFLTVDASAPPLAQTSVSFWAVRGQTREAEIRYQPRPGARTGDRLVRLKLDKRSLLNRPDGTPIAPGDSLLITITVVDPVQMIVQLGPAGLVFAPNREAQLTLWYLEADHDFNHDGVIDKGDAAIEVGFTIWRQESSAAPWEALSSVLTRNQDQLETEIPGFTRYAVAY
jgi:hypothetical protein